MSDRKQLNVRLPKELIKKAQHMAIEQDRPVQAIIEELLRKEVEKNKSK